MPSLFEKVNQLAILSVARDPEWTEQADTSGPPDTLAAGVSVRDAVVCQVNVALREQIHTKTSRLSIVFDGSTTYRVTIDGTDVDTAGNTDEATTLEDIADNINAAAVPVTATAADGEVEIKGDSPDHYSIAVSIVSGTGTISLDHEDASSAGVRVYVRPDGPTGPRPDVWTLHDVGEVGGLDFRGLNQEFDVSGRLRIYIEIYNADGDTTTHVGPGRLE